jgi:sec-independent protein translocase protein TatB
MLDMSWGEVMLIGGVALIVIGPKDLPKALRTVGQITSKLRRMAGEFQMQFNEAIREAELDDVRREVDGIRNTVRGVGSTFNPVQTIRDELKGAVEGRTKVGPEKLGPPPPAGETRSLAEATAQLTRGLRHGIRGAASRPAAGGRGSAAPCPRLGRRSVRPTRRSGRGP